MRATDGEKKTHGIKWWVWVAIVGAFIVGFAIGRSGPSSEETDIVSNAADTFDELAATMDVAAEAQQAEQEVLSLWADTMQAEIDGLRELQAEYPNNAWFDEAIGAAIDAQRLANASAVLADKYWNASKVDADRLRSLAARLRQYAD